MKRLSAIVMIVPTLFAIFLFGYLILYNVNSNKMLSQRQLQIAVNNAVDAATVDLLDTPDLEMDYADWGAMTIDPYNALNTFQTVLAMNLGFAPTDESRKYVVTHYIKLICVCVYDGFYIGTPIGDELVLSIKHPYTYKTEDILYGLNFNKKTAVAVNMLTGNVSTVLNVLDAVHTSAYITASIVDTINYELEKAYTSGWSYNVVIPYDLTKSSGVNTLSGPAIFAVINDADHNNECYGVGAAEIVTRDYIVAYRENGDKKYCYANKLSSTEHIIVDAIYPDMVDAAIDGYYYDNVRMSK